MKSHRPCAYLLLITIFWVLGAPSLEASTRTVLVDGTAFDKTVTVDGTTLPLKGTALLRYLVFIEAYTGAFYLPAGVDAGSVLTDVPKHLVLEYRVAIEAEDFARATETSIRRSVDDKTFESLRAKIGELGRLYRDVRPGDRYSLTCLPGLGIRLELNGEPLGTIAGADFAAAVFAIWLGENPIDTGFRDRLLGSG